MQRQPLGSRPLQQTSSLSSSSSFSSAFTYSSPIASRSFPQSSQYSAYPGYPPPGSAVYGAENCALPSNQAAVGQRRARDSPVVFEGPTKRRRATRNVIASKSDQEVWDMPDADIIDASHRTFRSVVYSHYTTKVARDNDIRSPTYRQIIFEFHCKHKNPAHRVVKRRRMHTSDGTQALISTARACDKALGVSLGSGEPPIAYSPIAHRALIALRSATSHRPFNMVRDRFYTEEVQMLRPGTILPSPATVSVDVKRLYKGMAADLCAYLVKRDLPFHLMIDGWTSPITTGELGLVVQWYADGELRRCILEFIKLKSNHTGKYLAECIFDCLGRCGIAHLLMLLNMDNASNCDTTAMELQKLLPSFEGKPWRLRCLLHILNLIAKAILLFFYKQYKRKKRSCDGQGTSEFTAAQDAFDIEEEEEEGHLPPEDEELAQTTAAQAEDDAAQSSTGEIEHDNAACKSVKDRAIYEMRLQGVTFSDPQAKECINIMTKVAGLARRINDTPSTLGVAFEKFVKSAPPENDDRNRISRRVATRWNSDYKCLDDYLVLKAAVEALTSQSDLKLHAYRLTQRQWELSKELRDLLRIFIPATEAFSQKETPLISDVLEVLDNIKEDLTNIRDSPVNLDKKLASPVVRIAAHAGLLMIDKYLSTMDECEVYHIAIALSPDKKLQWFRDRDWEEDAIESVRKRVLKRWTDSYEKPTNTTPPSPSQGASTIPEGTRGRDGWASMRRSRGQRTPAASQSAFKDDIINYLDSDVVPSAVIKERGGVIAYWHKEWDRTPRLARFASDYCSAPATTVDVERAFSEGRREVNFMQTQMCHDTFNASMVVGSLAKLPSFNLQKAIEILETEISSD